MIDLGQEGVMDESLSPFARQAALEAIIAKRDRIITERTVALEKRMALLAHIRRLDRELADCRAAARLFDLQVEFPEEEESPSATHRQTEFARRERERYLEQRRVVDEVNARVHAQVIQASSMVAAGGLERPALTQAVTAPVEAPKPQRPPIK